MKFTKSNHGFDISQWQSALDARKMLTWGAKFCILRAGHGLTRDSRFADFRAALKQVGIPCGYYWYYEPAYSPEQQANMLLSIIGGDRPEGRIWLDLEFPVAGQYSAPENWLKFLQIVERANFRVGIYTGYAWWIGQSGDKSAFSKYPLWLAWYTANEADVLIPEPWTKAMIWQDGTPAIGHVVGVGSADIDHDFWNGDYDFMAEWGQSPSQGENKMKFGKVTADTLNIRTGAGTSFPSVGVLKAGDIVTSDSQAAGWWHLVDAKRNGADVITNDGRPVRMIDCWASGAYIQEIPEPPPVQEPTITHTITVYSDGKISIDGGARQ
jgi:hypothetical protein